MRIFPLLLLAFLLIPIAEIYVLIEVGGIVGVGWTIALVVLTAVVGAAMMRAEGLATLQRVQNDMHQGGLPAQGLVEGAMLLLAGALLLTPGFITDTVGFIALFRPTRIALARWFVSRSVVGVMGSMGPMGAGHAGGGTARPGAGFHSPRPGSATGPGSARQPGKSGVIEGEFSREDQR